MATTDATSLELKAPNVLGLETRDSIRRDALKVLDGMPLGDGQLIIDLADTKSVDSAGLGALMLIQRHAAERRQVVALRSVSDELRFLLMLTKLDELFELVTAQA
jgi:anti-anti-sigma regulatory factor